MKWRIKASAKSAISNGLQGDTEIGRKVTHGVTNRNNAGKS